VTNEGSGDRDALFLTAGEGGAFCSDNGFVARWEGLNEFEDLAELEGLVERVYICVLACVVDFFLRYLVFNTEKNIESNRSLIEST